MRYERNDLNRPENLACQDRCPCENPCPLERVLALIGGKWKIRILCALHSDGATRYNDLKRKVAGITNTMLAGSLKELEAAALITRQQYMEMPVRVEYTITAKGEELVPILQQLAAWGIALLDAG